MDHQHGHLFPRWMYLFGFCGSTSSDLLEFNKIGVDTNILNNGWVLNLNWPKWDDYNTLCSIFFHL